MTSKQLYMNKKEGLLNILENEFEKLYNFAPIAYLKLDEDSVLFYLKMPLLEREG